MTPTDIHSSSTEEESLREEITNCWCMHVIICNIMYDNAICKMLEDTLAVYSHTVIVLSLCPLVTSV